VKPIALACCAVAVLIAVSLVPATPAAGWHQSPSPTESLAPPTETLLETVAPTREVRTPAPHVTLPPTDTEP